VGGSGARFPRDAPRKAGGLFGKSYISGALGVILHSGKTASEVPEFMRKASAFGEKMVSDFQHRKSIGQYKDAELHGVYENLKERGLIA
jgi:hypothetical protein